MTSVSEIWLDKNSQEVSEADAILHLRKGAAIWLRWRDAVTDLWRAASAETFGMALGVGYGRTVIRLRSAAGVTEYRGPHNAAPPDEEEMKQRIDQAIALMEGGANV